MELNKYTVALVSLAALSSPLSFADNNNQTNILLDKATHTDQVASISNQKNISLPKDKIEKEDVGYFSKGSFLPILGDAARAKGYTLPEPFGIGYNYMDIHQNIKVDTIELSGLSVSLPWIGNIPLDPDSFHIAVGKTREKSKTSTARLDTWLFPFMNIYGIVGHTKGSSVSKVTVDKVPFLGSSVGGLGLKDLLEHGQIQDERATLAARLLGIKGGCGVNVLGCLVNLSRQYFGYVFCWLASG